MPPQEAEHSMPVLPGLVNNHFALRRFCQPASRSWLASNALSQASKASVPKDAVGQRGTRPRDEGTRVACKGCHREGGKGTKTSSVVTSLMGRGAVHGIHVCGVNLVDGI